MHRILAIIALVSVATLAPPNQLLAAGGDHDRSHQAGATFARDVVARADAGWRLAWLKVGGSGDELRIELTMADGKQAESFALSFSNESGKVVSYRNAKAALPKEKRQYVIEQDVIATLRDGPVESIEFGCVHPYLESRGRGVAVDPDAYYRVVSRDTGKKAQRRLAREIAASLENGGHFVGADRADTQTVTLTVVGQDTTEMRAKLDKQGHVQKLEIRRYPLPQMWRHYRKSASLAKKLRAGKVIAGVVLSDSGLVLQLAGDKRLVLTDDDFQLEEEVCGC